MKLNTLRMLLLGAAYGALMSAPALAATGVTETAASSRDLTQEQQQAGAIPLPSFAPLAQHVLPAVVNISVQLDQQTGLQDESSGEDQGSNGNSGSIPQQFGQHFRRSPFDQFLRRFFENPFSMPKQGRQLVALGSGFVIDPRGYIVTNNHVVANAEKMTVTFQDQSQYPAKVVGGDKRTDLALLKIKTTKPLPYVTWGNSDKVNVGDWVVAVGNSFGLGGTVTAGIVSALGRNIDEGPYDDFLQVDAPINRGNSGGPTFDLTGQVVGINTAIYSPSGGSVGIGFAIPSQLAKYVVNQLEQNGKVTWGWLGVEIQNITPSIAKSLGLEHAAGALVASIVPDSPAAKAGLKSGDVIVAAADHPIRQAHDLPRIVAETPIGSKLDLNVNRDGKTRHIVADIGATPAKMASASGTGGNQPSTSPSGALGMQLASLSPELRKQLKIPNGVSGVVVASIAGDSPVAAMGVQTGDVIQSIDQKPATSPEQAAGALKEAAKRGNILLLIDRGGTNVFVGLTVKNGGTGNAG